MGGNMRNIRNTFMLVIGLLSGLLISMNIMSILVTGQNRQDVYKINSIYPAGRIQNSQASAAEDLYLQQETARMSDRLERAMNKCENYATINPSIRLQGRVWVYTPNNLAYCVTPKVGCTFWKRILRFLSKDYTDRNVSRPADIDRMRVHYDRIKNLKQLRLANPIDRTLLSQKKVNAFMFSRDPYSRLWSAYVDKFFLPDFWRSTGPHIVSKSRPNIPPNEKVCGNDISFTEFIKYVIHTLITNKTLNEHFTPIYTLCSPCHMRFEVLGKIETFQTDAEYIFKKFGLSDLSKAVSYSIKVEEEVGMLTKYNFDLEKVTKPWCFSRVDVAQKLWKTFQINGYISKNIPFPIDFVRKVANDTNIATLFKEKVLETIKEQNVDSLSLKEQKRNFLIEAYHDLPVTDLKMIPKLFVEDFELFDYNKYPKDIFPFLIGNQTTSK